MLVAVGLCCSLPAPIASADSVSQQLEQLRQQVHSLEQRVRQLEQTQDPGSAAIQNASVPPAAPTEAPAAEVTHPAPVTSVDPALQSLGRLKEAWKGIAPGMNMAAVRERLGEPASEFTIDNKSVWYYSYTGVGNGSVMFSTGGEVIGAQNPPFGFW